MQTSGTRWIVLCLAILVLAAAGCSREEPQRLDLVRFPAQADTATAAGPVLPDRALYLHQGWSHVEKEGVWALGEYAEAVLPASGKDLRLELVCAVSEILAEAGQRVMVTWEGAALDTLSFSGPWQPDTLIADLALPEGGKTWGRLGLIPLQHLSGDDHAFYLKSLAVSASLDRRALDNLDPPEIREEVRAELEMQAAGTSKEKHLSDNGQDGRPDLLVILLDAARSDHFGCYGYSRDTSPFIDSLAAEGVLFKDVTASAPYTLCSVPSLMTGVEWTAHGVAEQGDHLPSAFPTLAEMLAGVGYHTVGYSENPYVSAATGLDRGFREFDEVWDEGDDIRAQVLADLDGLPEDAPVFLYVHMMPPHEPYDPDPEHDIFTDPAYAGPAFGSADYLEEVDLGRMSWSEADRQHLVDLYDGNLRMADAWTRDIFKGVKAARPGRQLLTVVVSDHGEAFGEHQRFRHNSTLMSEMLQVPLVVHPADLAQGLQKDAQQLCSLADVTPMLLRTLNIPLDGQQLWPGRFLARYSGYPGPRKWVPLRTVSPPEYGLRTSNRLALRGSLTRQALYHIGHQDASADRRLDEAEVYLGMMAVLDAVLAGPVPDEAPENRAQFDEKAKQRLKSLGY